MTFTLLSWKCRAKPGRLLTTPVQVTWAEMDLHIAPSFCTVTLEHKVAQGVSEGDVKITWNNVWSRMWSRRRGPAVTASASGFEFSSVMLHQAAITSNCFQMFCTPFVPHHMTPHTGTVVRLLLFKFLFVTFLRFCRRAADVTLLTAVVTLPGCRHMSLGVHWQRLWRVLVLVELLNVE